MTMALSWYVTKGDKANKKEKENKTMMDYNEFLKELASEVGEVTNGEVRATVKHVSRANYDGDAIALRYEDKAMEVIIYPDDYYRYYLIGYADLEDCAYNMLETFEEKQPSFEFNVSDFLDFDKAKEHIVCRAIDRARNMDLLDVVPNMPNIGIAMVYYYEIDDEKSVLIRDEHVKQWGTSLYELNRIAKANTRKMYPATFQSMTEVLSEMFGCEVEGNGTRMYVLSNPQRKYGAVNILFNDVLQGIGRQLNEDFYILPSSVHEVIIIPASEIGSINLDELGMMVTNINGDPDIVSAEEVLCDSAFFFARDYGHLQCASN